MYNMKQLVMSVCSWSFLFLNTKSKRYDKQGFFESQSSYHDKEQHYDNDGLKVTSNSVSVQIKLMSSTSILFCSSNQHERMQIYIMRMLESCELEPKPGCFQITGKSSPRKKTAMASLLGGMVDCKSIRYLFCISKSKSPQHD